MTEIVKRTKTYEFTRLQQTLLCGAMADYSNKIERKLERVKVKKTFSIGIGKTIPAQKEYDRTFKELDATLETMKILGC